VAGVRHLFPRSEVSSSGTFRVNRRTMVDFVLGGQGATSSVFFKVDLRGSSQCDFPNCFIDCCSHRDLPETVSRKGGLLRGQFWGPKKIKNILCCPMLESGRGRGGPYAPRWVGFPQVYLPYEPTDDGPFSFWYAGVTILEPSMSLAPKF
jgi:hypothetical protein